MKLQLRISGFHYEMMKKHLLREDGREAIAVALCGRYSSRQSEMLLVHDVTLIQSEQDEDSTDFILHWKTAPVHKYFELISKRKMGLLKIHSHPGGYGQFSAIDDISDYDFFTSAFGWAINDQPHASAVMLPNGEIFGRFFFSDLKPNPIDKTTISGDQILNFVKLNNTSQVDFALRTIQAFGDKTYQYLSGLSVGIVGCSGTGSPVIEQLVRLGVGKVVLVDPDVIETKNLNRILNTTKKDAQLKKPKVVAITEAINTIGLGTAVEKYQTNLYDDVYALKALIECDVIFGCVDSVDGRYLLNQLCSFYLIPYFDLGVSLEADGKGGINKICGSVHYLQPCKSSLITRGVYTIEDLKAASQFRKNPEEFGTLRKSAYIKNVNVNSPAVISVNMQIASQAVNEFLNRIHPFRAEHPSYYALSTIDITENYIVNSREDDFSIDNYLTKRAGKGDVNPFLEMSELCE
jgi:hypothetical protein